ncbi:MAG: hypothetical protein KC423_20490 [Anaerolineales bacterium]|nr:hypothetical protein [Anaerolineales bacterium]
MTIGAGYAGLMATVRLWKKTQGLPVVITLVNADDTFGERERLHQLAAGQTLRNLPIAGFFARNGRFLMLYLNIEVSNAKNFCV